MVHAFESAWTDLGNPEILREAARHAPKPGPQSTGVSLRASSLSDLSGTFPKMIRTSAITDGAIKI